MYLLIVTESSVAIAKNRTNSTSPESSFIIHMSILTNRLIYFLSDLTIVTESSEAIVKIEKNQLLLKVLSLFTCQFLQIV